MKIKNLLAMFIIAILLFSTVNCFSVAFAMEANPQAEQNITAEDTVDSAEEIVLTDEYGQLEEICSDNSVTMRHEDKSRRYHRGEFYPQTMTVQDENYTFVLSDYDWYKVDYNNGYVLAGDIASNLRQINGIFVAAIFVFPVGIKQLSVQETFDVDVEENHSVQIVYTNSEETVCTKVIVPITDANFQQLLTMAKEWELSKENTDEISRNLIESFSYEDNFKLRMYNSSNTYSLSESQAVARAASYGNYANSNKTVSCNAFDNYTDTDSFIKDYASTYCAKTYQFLSGSTNVRYSDDPIVKIIPRNLFTSRNTYSFIGKEYGFFIKTVQDSGNDNVSSFIVFDIQTVAPYPERTNDNPFSVKVVPLFSGIVKYSATQGVITGEGYADPNLALGNVRVAVSVQNANQKNFGDAGYDAYQDYGYAISSYAVDASGTGPKKKEDNASAALLSLTLGCIGCAPKATIFSVASTIVGAIDFITDSIDSNRRNTTLALNGSGTKFSCSDYMIGNNNLNSMISIYGNLVKGFETKLLNSSQQVEENYPLLYKNSNHYYQTVYSFCQRNSDINWDAMVATYVSLDIFQDNTNLALGFIQSGKVERLDGVIGGRIDWYNERPSVTQGGDVQEDIFYHTDFIKDNNADEESHEEESYSPAAGSYRDFYFTPSRTFYYVIETFNSMFDTDPYLKIYDSQNKLLARDDDSGGNGRAKISITLTGGQVYKIRTLCHRYKAGAYDFVIRKGDALIGANRTELNPNPVTLEHDSVWFTYVPFYDDFYTFSSSGNADTCFTLYDNNYNRLAYDDDGGSGRNSNIDMYLKAGKTYYLKVNLYNMGSGQSVIYVNRQKTLVYRSTQNSLFSYLYYSDSAQFFRFVPLETRTYVLTTKLDLGDPYMELYDASWNRLAYNDDGGEGHNAQISYELQAGQTYYIKIRGYNANQECGYVHF